jgi:glucose 1-dehydrogenase
MLNPVRTKAVAMAMATATDAPPNVPHNVVRTRLITLLERRWEHAVTTVVAGAGFGKSIAIGQSMRANQLQARGVEVRVSCRQGCEDPDRFVASVRRAFGSDTRVHGSPLAQLEAVIAEQAPLATCLVLDDVEELTAACASLVERAQQACGGLTLLVSNAGASVRGALADLPVEQWDASFALNVRPTWLLAKAARPALAAAHGSIVAIASMSGLHPHPGYGAYSPAKAALVMLCRQLAQEWADQGIRVNAVCPGMIRTPLTEAVYQDAQVAAQREALVPLARIGRSEDIGAAVAYLASAGASYVTGQQLVVDGGVADHMLALIPGRAAPAA